MGEKINNTSLCVMYKIIVIKGVLTTLSNTHSIISLNLLKKIYKIKIKIC